ncbi:MAG: TonB C-terminal domain-containing protein [Nitrospirae bacterium]|nr:TonB C-terminal domain-containing protein [Nitrospirota bacterium]
MAGEFFAKIISPEDFMPPTSYIPEISKIRPVHPTESQKSIPNTNQGFVSNQVKKSETLSLHGKEPAYPQSYQSNLPSSSGLNRQNIGENKVNTPKPDLPNTSLKEKLFDNNIIRDIAKREIKKEEPDAKTFSFNIKDMRYLPYLRRLKERIESIWIYPPDAATKGIYGDLIIKFTIKKNGSLGAIELLRTSGHKSLDDAALSALKEAEPFWPLPDEWGMETYTIEGHFIYTIYGYYLR